MTISINSGLVSCVCALVVSAAVAEGSDRKIYAATNCRPAAGTKGTTYVSQSGVVYNTSPTDQLILVCPIVRDSTVDGYPDISVVVRNPVDAEPGADDEIACKAEIRYNNAALYREDFQFLGPNGTDWEVLSFTAQPAPDFGFYQLVCKLPKSTGSFAPGIASYSVVEFAP
jgi:hypothetical protein